MERKTASSYSDLPHAIEAREEVDPLRPKYALLGNRPPLGEGSQVPMWETSPSEHAGLPRHLDGFPPPAEAPSSSSPEQANWRCPPVGLTPMSRGLPVREQGSERRR